MPWREVTRISLREEFVQLALPAGVNRRELCRRFAQSHPGLIGVRFGALAHTAGDRIRHTRSSRVQVTPACGLLKAATLRCSAPGPGFCRASLLQRYVVPIRGAAAPVWLTR